MAKITFNSVTILDDTEGGINTFNEGQMTRKREYFENARGDGEGVKFFNKPGTIHTINFTFDNVSTGNLSTIKSRVAQFADYTNIGTLSVTPFGFSANNCIVDSVNLESQIKRIANIETETLAHDSVWELTYSMTFKQVK